ncbi:hypothetical protein NC651_003373 [Populus alba x Populus x berolinensis]|nr:hypothetical protein NC651_003373 [Populus alba x Populus x berolinensis]
MVAHFVSVKAVAEKKVNLDGLLRLPNILALSDEERSRSCTSRVVDKFPTTRAVQQMMDRKEYKMRLIFLALLSSNSDEDAGDKEWNPMSYGWYSC